MKRMGNFVVTMKVKILTYCAIRSTLRSLSYGWQAGFVLSLFLKLPPSCSLFKRSKTSIASVVRELALEALELREDYYLSKLAQNIDKKGVKAYSHDEAWA